jgi:hypothetical protein
LEEGASCATRSFPSGEFTYADNKSRNWSNSRTRDDECCSGEGTIFYDVSLNLFPDHCWLVSLVQTTMRQDLKKAPRERFVQMYQEACQVLLIALGLENICQELDKEYAAILNQK